MAGMTEHERREKAIDAVAEAIASSGVGFGFGGDLRVLAGAAVDAITEHAVETVRALIAAEEGLKTD